VGRIYEIPFTAKATVRINNWGLPSAYAIKLRADVKLLQATVFTAIPGGINTNLAESELQTPATDGIIGAD